MSYEIDNMNGNCKHYSTYNAETDLVELANDNDPYYFETFDNWSGVNTFVETLRENARRAWGESPEVALHNLPRLLAEHSTIKSALHDYELPECRNMREDIEIALGDTDYFLNAPPPDSRHIRPDDLVGARIVRAYSLADGSGIVLADEFGGAFVVALVAHPELIDCYTTRSENFALIEGARIVSVSQEYSATSSSRTKPNSRMLNVYKFAIECGEGKARCTVSLMFYACAAPVAEYCGGAPTAECAHYTRPELAYYLAERGII